MVEETKNMPSVDDQYQRLIKARNFHYDNLNKWLMSFYVIIGALFIALYTLHSSAHLHRYMEIAVAMVGYVVSFGALLSGKGYSFWEMNWILLLQDLERKAVPEQKERVYSIMADEEVNNNAMNPISGANVSTTKVTLLITSIVTVLWGMIVIYLGCNLLGWFDECRIAKVGVGLVISAIVSWLLMWGGSNWLHSDLNNLDDLKHPKKEMGKK